MTILCSPPGLVLEPDVKKTAGLLATRDLKTPLHRIYFVHGGYSGESYVRVTKPPDTRMQLCENPRVQRAVGFNLLASFPSGTCLG